MTTTWGVKICGECRFQIIIMKSGSLFEKGGRTVGIIQQAVDGQAYGGTILI